MKVILEVSVGCARVSLETELYRMPKIGDILSVRGTDMEVTHRLWEVRPDGSLFNPTVGVRV